MPRLFTVDSFTDTPFRGNPAAVCVTDGPASEAWMQSLAGEMNLSETAFVHRQSDRFALRWFTPRMEVDLCGHATLATAFVLWKTGVCEEGESIRFHTRSGLLECTRKEEWIAMDFPALPVVSLGWHSEVEKILGEEILICGRHGPDLLAEISDERKLQNLHPDLEALETLPVRGLIVTSRSDSPEFDCVSRFFAPRFGIDEDPVTGSAHCALAPYWAAKLGKHHLTGFQASKRGGVVRMELRENDRVFLLGQAVLIGKTQLSPAAMAGAVS